MHIRTRIALAALAVLSALTLVAGTAGARRFEISEQRFVTTFERLSYSGGGLTVACRATLSGSFHSRTMSKVSDALVGYITEATTAHPCIEGEGWMLNGTERPSGEERAPGSTLPWHIHYLSFVGALPNITRVEIVIIGYAYLETVVGISCLSKSTLLAPALLSLSLSSGRITGWRWDESHSIPKFAGGPLCPPELVLSGTGNVATPGTSREISVRLVQ